MQLSRFLFGASWLLLPLALLSTTWLYLYPLFHGCAFPQPSTTSLPLLSARAPFRLLALGDPQLEGDSSLPDPTAPVFPSLQNVAQDMRHANYDPHDVADILRTAARGVVKDAAAWLEGHRKAVDLWGNDLYLAHIVRSLRWWTEPSHVAVLGDLLGSQWITDGEFEKRAGRYWGTVMRGLERVPDEVMGAFVESDYYDEEEAERRGRRSWGGTSQVLGGDEAWEKRVINIAGNHDIGYAGDIDEARVDRFERAFGSVNWDVWFTLPDNTSTNTTTNDTSNDNTTPALRLVVLNTMNLDTPAYKDSLQQDTYAFMNHLITTSRPVTDKTHATILLTHIPLHKPAGICVDAPFFDYFDSGHGVREQNMLSPYGSRVVLESIFGLSKDVHAEGQGLGRRGIVVNGHDHAGCDTLHWIHQPAAPGCNPDGVNPEDAYSSKANDTQTIPDDTPSAANSTPQDTDPDHTWRAAAYPPRTYALTSEDKGCTHIPASPHLRELTLRSMMGDFSGYAGFLSAWFDPQKGERGEWILEFGTCGVGVQHWWWGVHILDLLLVGCFVAGCVVRAWESLACGGGGCTREKGEKGIEEKEKRTVLKKGKVVKLEVEVEPGATRLADTKRAAM